MGAESSHGLYFSEAPVLTQPEEADFLPTVPEVQFSAPDTHIGTLVVQEAQITQLSHEVEAICNEYPDWQENRQSYEAVVDLAATLSQPLFGSIGKWRQAGVPRDGLPQALHRIASHKLFARQCVRHELAVDDFGEARMVRLRSLERSLLEDIGGVPYDLSRDFRLAMQERTMKFDDDGYIIPLNKSGGLDDHEWHITMTRFIENYNSLDDGQVKSVRDLFGTINFDRYSPAQLLRMAKFAQKDPETLKRLGDSDLLVHFSDAKGDYNGSSATDPEHFDKDGDSLFFEIARPADFYRSLITLTKLYGVKPSMVAVSLHGDPGYMDFGDENNKFLMSAFNDEQADNVVNLEQAHTSRLFRDFMKPHKESGLRHVILSSCSQAASANEHSNSLAQLLAVSSAPTDNVLVSASYETISCLESDSEYLYFINKQGKRSIIHNFRRSSPPGPPLIKTMSSRIKM